MLKRDLKHGCQSNGFPNIFCQQCSELFMTFLVTGHSNARMLVNFARCLKTIAVAGFIATVLSVLMIVKVFVNLSLK